MPLGIIGLEVRLSIYLSTYICMCACAPARTINKLREHKWQVLTQPSHKLDPFENELFKKLT